MTNTSTLVRLLRDRAEERPDGLAYIFLNDGEIPAARLTWSALDRSARAIAARLRLRGAAGERALLLYPSGLEFVAAFFGCLYAGMIAVPAYPPRRDRDVSRIAAILDDADAACVLTTGALLDTVRDRLGSSRRRRTEWRATDAMESDVRWTEPTIGSEAVAYLQYTSGSTAMPKGVAISHRNIQRNLDSIDRAFAHDAASVSVTWLPHFHDMGLVYGILAPLHRGFTCVMMSPAAFAQRPVRWLNAISQYKATHSGGPNFAYALCARRVTAEQRGQLDLSRWRVAFNGAEPVSGETLEQFFQAFRGCGFVWTAFYPAYGLAEATLKVSGGFVRGIRPSGSASALSDDGHFDELPDGRALRPACVGCGWGDVGDDIRIVDPASALERALGEVGEIWVSGPGVANGYWNRPAETQATFRAFLSSGEGPYLRTGDLGCIRDGELVVSGRLKDLIIIRGQNHHPEDIEETACHCHPALRRGYGAAFSVSIGGEERLVLVYELERMRPVDADDVAQALRHALSEEHQLQLYALALIETGALPRTPSGKVQRSQCRAAFLDNSLAVVQKVVDQGGVEYSSAAALTIDALLASPEEERASLLIDYLIELAAGVTGVTAIRDPDCPFSRWGVDSLAGVELTHRLEIQLGVAIPITRFLDRTTPRDLARAVLADIEAQNPSRMSQAAAAASRTVEYPASYGQRALLFSHETATDGSLYNLAAAFRIGKPLDTNALRRSVQALVDRHTSLRTGFVLRGDEVIAVERVQDIASVDVVDAGAWDTALLHRRLHQEATRPFDLERDTLLRATAFARSATEWILLLTVHHAASDFRSVEVLLDELTRFYRSDSAADALAAPAIEYADYARWQRQMLEGPDGERLWAYWRTQLRPPWPSGSCPSDRGGLARANGPTDAVPFRIERHTWERLLDVARSRETTAFTVVLAALQVLLHRRSGQPDVIVGCPALGRSRAPFANVVGSFVQPVALRADLSDDPTWPAFVDRAKVTVHEALEHQDYPFSLIVERLRVPRDSARSPLFQVMLVWQTSGLLHDDGLAALSVGNAGPPLQLNGLTLEPVPLSIDAARYELTVMVAPSASGAAGCIKYDSSRWNAGAIEQMTRQFLTLLDGIIAHPHRRCSCLPLSSPSSGDTSRKAEPDPASTTTARLPLIHELFERQAERHPRATAVVCGADRLSYADLNARANQIARHLRAAGIGRESLVGLCLDRSIWMVASLLAVWKCGAAYVPLDPAYPSERLALLVRRGRLRLIVTQRGIASRLPDRIAPTLLVDDDWPDIQARDARDLVIDVMPSQLAYAIYTSGSTGVPKGVMVEHRAVSNLYGALCGWIYADMAADGTVALNASFGFDASIKQIVMLARGSTLHILPEDVRSSASRLLSYAESHQIDAVDCTPSLLRMLVDGGLLHKSFPRRVLCGGESIDSALWAQLRECAGAVRVYNVYGPTECTVDATGCEVRPVSPNIGLPLANVDAHVLDAALTLVPPEIVGELYIGGAGLGRGYLEMPAATAARFIPDPFSHRAGSRMYRTGDLVRSRLDGSLEFIGRADAQMKLRGFRVEPIEIEEALRRHPAVRDAAVVKLQDDFGDDRLVAYVQATEEPAGSADLAAFLGRTLPAYMVPSAFVPIDAFPMTPHGKLDRAALRARRLPMDHRPAEVDRPRTHLEGVLAALWARALGVAAVGIHDNFFERGGHSLTAMRVSAELQQTFPVTAPIMTLLFENPTLERFATAIVTHGASDVDLERIAVAVQRLDMMSDDDAEALTRRRTPSRLDTYS